MKANYNVTGNDRKALVAAIENLTGDKAIYMRMPTCAYEIGDITVDKEGSVTCEDADKLERIIHNLIADGFTPEDTEEVESDDEATGLTVSLPLDKVAVGNLTNLLTAKERLIKKALGIDDLGIEVRSDALPVLLDPYNRRYLITDATGALYTVEEGSLLKHRLSPRYDECGKHRGRGKRQL